MSKHLIATAFFWIVLTAIGEGLALLDLFPAVGSVEAEDFDQIFRILLFMGIPVFTFVVAILVYAMLGFRSRGVPEEDGPAMHGTGMVPKIWLGVTGGLAILVMIYPGLTGLAKLQSNVNGYGWGDEDPEMVINVTAFRWSWQFDYADAGVRLLRTPGTDLVLPNDTVIKFDINSNDVVHSFWIPAFRMKIDAIPGRTTTMTVKTREMAAFYEDSAFRVQCAELCGLAHSDMQFPVRVVSKAEFNDWLASQKKTGK